MVLLAWGLIAAAKLSICVPYGGVNCLRLPPDSEEKDYVMLLTGFPLVITQLN